MGRLTMRSCPVEVVVSTPTKKYVDFLSCVELLEPNNQKLARRHHLFVEYTIQHRDVRKLFDDLAVKFASYDAHLCIGTLVDPNTDESNILVYVRKACFRQYPDMTLEGQEPCAYYGPVVSTRRQESLMQALTVFSSVISTSATTILIHQPSNDTGFSYHQIEAAVRKLSSIDILKIKGQIIAKPEGSWTVFDQQFMKLVANLMQVRRLENSTQGIMLFNAYAPPFPVCPLDQFINMDQQGTRLKEVVMTEEMFSLKDPFRRASILSNFSVILLGSSATTGFGKTQCTLRLAIEWVKAYCEHHNTPKDSALVYMSSTIDPAKNISFKAGMAWVLDEFHPFDSEQLVHCSETMLKVLLTPQMAGTLRGRKDDVQLVPGVARLISANSNSPAEWCGANHVWSEPLRRKSICYSITEPLCSETWRMGAELNGSSTQVDFDTVLTNNTRTLK